MSEFNGVAIRVESASVSALRFVDELAKVGSFVVRVNLAENNHRDQMLDELAAAFALPHPMGGLDGAVDWFAEPDWLDLSQGLVVAVAGLDDCAAVVRRDFVGLLPWILNRWREGRPPKPYVFVLEVVSQQEEVLDVLSQDNEHLRLEGRRVSPTHTGPVPILVDGQLWNVEQMAEFGRRHPDYA